MDYIMTRLRGIETEVRKLKRNGKMSQEKLTLAIEVDPLHPPRSLQHLLRALMAREQILTNVTVHQHSSLKSSCSTDLMQWLGTSVSNRSRTDNQLNLSWIWKPIGRHPVAKVVNLPNGDIRGEPAIARLFARLFESWTENMLYESFDLNTCAQIDEWLDLWEGCSNQTGFSALIKRIESRLAAATWLAGPPPGVKSLADIFLASILSGKLNSVRGKEWMMRCASV